MYYREDYNEFRGVINEFDEALNSLKGKKHIVTKKEEEEIIKIAKKYKYLG